MQALGPQGVQSQILAKEVWEKAKNGCDSLKRGWAPKLW
ncbi:hypothetical protein GFS31_23170 [Leptolyngbya sp. BL0902]|nr:hypothetical protein GFS31_23170 [Leptolyngbya sp. BL0902]